MKYVLITGASCGIGKQIAYEYAKHNYSLILVARRENILKQIKKDICNKYDVDVKVFGCDVSKDPKATYDYCKKHKLDVDILINNAGYGDFCEFVDADIDKLTNMIDLNDKALVSLCHLFGNDMKAKKHGHIVNVASIASFMPGPYMAVYYASKSFVLSFSMALRNELEKDGVKISTLCPGPTTSEFWDVAGSATSFAYNSFARNCEQVAKTCFDMQQKNKPYAVDGFLYKVSTFFMRHLPLTVSSKICGYIQSKTKSKN